MTDAPTLPRLRGACLQAFRRQPRLMDRAFMARELLVIYREGGRAMAGTGATLESLRQAGWVSGVIHDFGGAGALFRMVMPVTMWQSTDAGRESIRQCPDIFPGESVYGRKP